MDGKITSKDLATGSPRPPSAPTRTRSEAAAAQRERAWAERVPGAYRDRRLTDYNPPFREYAGKLLDGQTWCLLLFGGVGSGKTSFAVAVMREWFERYDGWPVLVTAERLAAQLHDFSQADDRVYGWKRAAMLVLDDIGASRATDYVRPRVLEIISHRYDHQRPTIVTSNLDPAGLARQWDGENARLVSRLGEGVYVNFGQRDRRKDVK